MIDKTLIREKEAEIVTHYDRLASLLEKETSIILADDLILHTVERLFQLIVDAALDINTHLISELGLMPPTDYYNTFMTLGENKIVPYDFATKIAGSVGLRNMVVHRYKNVDLKKMINDMKMEIGQYAEYLQHIRVYLARDEVKP